MLLSIMLQKVVNSYDADSRVKVTQSQYVGLPLKCQDLARVQHVLSIRLDQNVKRDWMSVLCAHQSASMLLHALVEHVAKSVFRAVRAL